MFAGPLYPGTVGWWSILADAPVGLGGFGVGPKRDGAVWVMGRLVLKPLALPGNFLLQFLLSGTHTCFSRNFSMLFVEMPTITDDLDEGLINDDIKYITIILDIQWVLLAQDNV